MSAKLKQLKDKRWRVAFYLISNELSIGDDMRTMIKGFLGWAKVQNTRNESLRVTDTAITVVATLLAAVTWAVLRG